MLWLKKLQLKVGGVQARIKAIEALVASGDPRASELIAEEALQQPDAEVQRAAAEALGKVGKVGDSRALESLRIMIQFGAPEVQVAAAEAIGKIGDKKGIPLLIDALKINQPSLQTASKQALSQFGEAAIQDLIHALRISDRASQSKLTAALVDIGADVVPHLVSALGDKKGENNDRLRAVLEQIGAAGIPPLAESLASADESARKEIVSVVSGIEGDEATDLLVVLMRDPSPAVHTVAAKSLKQRGWSPKTDQEKGAFAVALRDWNGAAQVGPEAIPPLISALKNLDTGQWEAAAAALTKLGEAASEALLPLMQDADSRVKGRVLQTLGELADSSAIEAMKQALVDADASIRESAVLGLWRIGGTEAAEGLLEALQDEDPLIRSRAARALGDLGEAKAVDALLAVADGDRSVRIDAVLAVAKIAPLRAVNWLAELTKETAATEEAFQALGKILTEHLADICDEDLLTVARLPLAAPQGLVKTVDGSEVCRLAQSELQRRGIEV
ncbi:MAG: phycocyanobilin lyase [Gemmatales bacterium]|nr:MAG: phycocyanobilin lyase [Gemmatales bacterium]